MKCLPEIDKFSKRAYNESGRVKDENQRISQKNWFKRTGY